MSAAEPPQPPGGRPRDTDAPTTRLDDGGPAAHGDGRDHGDNRNHAPGRYRSGPPGPDRLPGAPRGLDGRTERMPRTGTPPRPPEGQLGPEPSGEELTDVIGATDVMGAADAVGAPGDSDATQRLTPVGPPPGRGPARRGPAPLASWRTEGSSDDTVLLPRPPLEQDASAVPAPRLEADERDDDALVRASGGMAVATLVSRLTGFLRTLALAGTVGLGLVGSSFQIANTLPNIIFELLLGGVLTSVVIPVLVRAAKEDGDHGDAFAQKLLSGAAAVLFVATVAATAASPWLVLPYIEDPNEVELASQFAYLLLPQIFFYGMGALFGAILNARSVFGPAAWSPVLNNVIVIAALIAYYLLPNLPGGGISTTQLLVVGLGSTLGIVVQAAVMLPAMRRTGFRWRWRFGWDRRLSEFGGLAAWVIAYVLVSQLALTVITRVAFAHDPGGPAIYGNAWLLIQVPYGVLGVSLLTALMPRMSAAAANGRTDQVVADLSLGSRLSAVTLLPVSAILTLLGPSLGLAMFSLGRSGADSAETLGATLSASAFGLLPLAVVMLQLRVFYAMNDARTPTLIMVVMTVVKIPLAYLCPVLLEPRQVVLGLAAVNAFGFVVGLVVGDVWLRRRLGHLDTRRVLRTYALTALASLLAVGAGALAMLAIDRLLAPRSITLHAWLSVGAGGVLSLVVAVVAMRSLRVPELDPVAARIRRLVGRPGAAG